MNVQTMLVARTGRNEEMFLGGFTALAAVAALLLAPAAAHAADPGGPGPAGKNPAMNAHPPEKTAASRRVRYSRQEIFTSDSR